MRSVGHTHSEQSVRRVSCVGSPSAAVVSFPNLMVSTTRPLASQLFRDSVCRLNAQCMQQCYTLLANGVPV